MTAPEPATRIAQLRADVEAVLRSAGADAALRALSGPGPGPGDRAKIVLVGEVGSGKTSLVNALVGRPQLLPVQPSRTYVAVGAGQHEELRAHLADGTVITGELDGITSWLSPRDGDEVATIEVLVHNPWLDKLTLFDTPGVGGTDPVALTLTLQAIEGAAALVFVCSGEAKISLAERDFLRNATRRIEHVLFVLTKVDLLDDLGAANLRENEDALAAEADRRYGPNRFGSITFVPVSSLLAEEGEAGDDDALADSGIVELRHRLSAIAERTEELLLLNEMRVIKSALSEAHQLLGRRKAALTREDSRAERQQIVERIAELRTRKANARTTLSRNLFDAKDEVQAHMRRERRALREKYRQRANVIKPKDVPAAEAELTEDLSGLLRGALGRAADLIGDIAGAETSGLPDAAPIVGALMDELCQAGLDPSDVEPSKTTTTRGIGELLSMLRNFTSGSMTANTLHNMFGSGHAAAGVAGTAAAAAFAPYAATAGVLMVVADLRQRGISIARSGLHRYAVTFIDDVNAELHAQVETLFRKASYLLPEAVDSAFDAAIVESNEILAALDSSAVDSRAAIDELKAPMDELAQLGRRWNLEHQSLTASITAMP